MAGSVPNVSKAVVIVAPHTSNWDFLVGVAAMFGLGLRVTFLGKDTLFGRPLGSLMRWLGGVPVDRGVSSGIVDETAERFGDCDRMILALSPEGTRSSVTRWRTGFYFIAQRAEVPIIPVRLDYGRKSIHFGTSLDPTGDIDKDLRTLQGFFSDVMGFREG